jgi:hypothetical protein
VRWTTEAFIQLAAQLEETTVSDGLRSGRMYAVGWYVRGLRLAKSFKLHFLMAVHEVIPKGSKGNSWSIVILGARGFEHYEIWKGTRDVFDKRRGRGQICCWISRIG